MKNTTTAICSLLLAATTAFAQSAPTLQNQMQQNQQLAVTEFSLLGSQIGEKDVPPSITAPNSDEDPNGITPVLFSIGEDVMQETPTVYPNPSKGDVKVRFPESLEVISLEVYDNTGKVIYINRELSNKNFLEMPIDLKAEMNGMYMIMFRTKDAVYVEKLILQK